MTVPQYDIIYLATSTACVVLGAVFDVRSRRIPNFLTGPALLLGLALHAALGGWQGLGSAFLAALICGGIFFVLFATGGMGAGDVKLIAAAGCIAGLPHVASILVLTGLSGGVMALALIIMRQRVKQTLWNVGALVQHHRAHGMEPHPEINISNKNALRLPYAVAIASGVALTFCLFVAHGGI